MGQKDIYRTKTNEAKSWLPARKTDENSTASASEEGGVRMQGHTQTCPPPPAVM